MDWSKYSLDIFLVPLSVCVTIGYHVFLWYKFKNKHPSISIGAHSMMRRAWFLHAIEDEEKKCLLTVQSLRNALMTIILVSLVAVILNSSLAAQTNNVYNAHRLVHASPITYSAESTQILKYEAASLFLLLSFFCCSMAVGSLTEAGFLAHVTEEWLSQHAYCMLERGCMLATAGERVLCVTLPLLLWMFGPVAMTLSSMAMVWVLYQLDFMGSEHVSQANQIVFEPLK